MCITVSLGIGPSFSDAIVCFVSKRTWLCQKLCPHNPLTPSKCSAVPRVRSLFVEASTDDVIKQRLFTQAVMRIARAVLARVQNQECETPILSCDGFTHGGIFLLPHPLAEVWWSGYSFRRLFCKYGESSSGSRHVDLSSVVLLLLP